MAATVLGEDVVVWRSSAGVSVWRDLCVHRGTRLSLGTICNDHLKCRYHGWEYDAAGACVAIPAEPDIRIPARARASRIYRAVEYADAIWVCLGEQPQELPRLPQLSDASYHLHVMGPYELGTAAPRAVENFLDLTHPAFVHDGVLGSIDRPEITPYKVERRGDGLFVEDVSMVQPDPDGMGEPKEVSYDFGVLAPTTVYFIKHVGDRSDSEKFVLMYAVTPVREKLCHAHFIAAFNYGSGEMRHEEIADYHTEIIMQDKVVLESQRPELLPLDLSSELHLGTDLLPVSYRRWLKELGVRYGTQ